MKTASYLAAALLATSLSLIGCDDKTTTTDTKTTTDAKAAADATSAKTMDAAAKVKDAVTSANATAGNNMSAAGDAISTQAQDLYTKATAAISTMKLDDAAKYVDQLKALRDKLPADWQTKVDELVKTYTDAKAKLGALPAGLPTMGH